MNKNSRYKNVLFIINPASGKDVPILNTINDVFKDYKNTNWDVMITKKFGDAFNFTKDNCERYDLIAVYGGDGTVHEVINATIRSTKSPKTPLALLPGGTGNGFLTGLGIPHDLGKALNVIFKGKEKGVDVAKVGDKFCISRMYTGVEEDMQTSRAMKNKYGTFAYAINSVKQTKNIPIIDYTIEIDGKIIKEKATKVYIANSGSTGTYISLGNFDVHDGYLNVFTVNKGIKSMLSTAHTMWNTTNEKETLHQWKGKHIIINSMKSQPVWIDGEPAGRTPIEVKVIPSAIKIIIP